MSPSSRIPSHNFRPSYVAVVVLLLRVVIVGAHYSHIYAIITIFLSISPESFFFFFLDLISLPSSIRMFTCDRHLIGFVKDLRVTGIITFWVPLRVLLRIELGIKCRNKTYDSFDCCSSHLTQRPLRIRRPIWLDDDD